MSAPLPLRIQGLRRPQEDALHLQLTAPGQTFHLLLLLTKPKAGVHHLCDRPLSGAQPHGSQGPWRHRLLNQTIVGLRQAPGLWELQLKSGQVLALNWRRKQAGIRLSDRSVLGGAWLQVLPLSPPLSSEEIFEQRKDEQVASWRRQVRRRLESQIAAIETAKVGDPETLRQRAQRLSSLRHQVRQEAEVFWLPQYQGAEPPDSIDRRAGEGLQDRIDRFYKEARRLERRDVHQGERLIALKKRLLSIASEEPPKPTQGLTKSSPTKPLERGVRVYRLASGRELLVGRDAKANHRVTFGLGRGRDLWFHRRNGPGPHVILRRGKDDTVPEDEILLAAAVALRLSLRATEGQEEVRWTERRFLDPVPGQPGKALVRKERVLLVDLGQHREAIDGLFNR